MMMDDGDSDDDDKGYGKWRDKKGNWMDPPCMGAMDVSPKCMDYNYEYLATDNMMEWFVSLVMMWDNFGMLALLGPLLVLGSFASIIDVWFCDWCLPNIH